MREVFIPNAVMPHVGTPQSMILEGLLGRGNEFRGIGRVQVRDSLLRWGSLMEREGTRVSEIMNRHKKAGVNSPNRKFCIEPMLGFATQTVYEDGYGTFYMDTKRGIALGAEIEEDGEEKKLWIGVVGIALGRELDSYDPDHRGEGRMNFPYHFPAITQIQGPNKEAYYEYEDAWGDKVERSAARHNMAIEILKEYKWERALIDLVLDWTSFTRIPAVYLLPARLNRYSRGVYPIDPSFKLRYDVSAKRMGFKMQPNGLYGMLVL